jgi:uncharacterized protein (DUF362 family)
LDLILASRDTFSVDWVASEIMGFNPSKVPFLKLAIKEQLGEAHGILTRGESVTTFSKIFPKPKGPVSNYGFAIQFALLKAYIKLAGDIVPPTLEG